jgi:hypothetical protein
MSAFYTIFAGREKLRVPRAWDTFVYHGRRYRLCGGRVEVQDGATGMWTESLVLAYSGPKGRPRGGG